MNRRWSWDGLHRDGKPVMYENGEPRRRLLRGERDLTPEEARLIAAAPRLLRWMQQVVLTDYTGVREWEARELLRFLDLPQPEDDPALVEDIVKGE